MRLTNPAAYAEWYADFYPQLTLHMSRDVTTDGRESVHSGRSSVNDKER